MRTSAMRGELRVRGGDAAGSTTTAADRSRSRDRRLNAIVISGVLTLFVGLGLLRVMEDQELPAPGYPAKPRWAKGGAETTTPSTRVYLPECDAAKLSADEVPVIITAM